MNKLSKHLLVPVFSLMMFSNELLAKENPSFDCTKATTEVEKLICSDDELAKKLDNVNKCKIYDFLDCQQVQNQVDDLTCSDTELFKLYEKMQKKYFEFCRSLSKEIDKIRLYKDHLEWINTQNSSDYMQFGGYNRRIFYLREAYLERIDNLEKLSKKTVNK